MSTKRNRYYTGSSDTKTRKSKNGVPSFPAILPFKQNTEPGDDFYMYINGKWLRNTSIPPYLSSYSVSDEIEKQIDDELLTILYSSQNRVKGTPNKNISTNTYLLGTLTESALNSNVQDLNINLVRHVVSRFGCIRSSEDIGSTLGEFIRLQINCVLSFTVTQSETDTKTHRIAINPGKLGLPDSSYYYGDTADKKLAIVSYGNLLKILGDDFNIPNIESIIGFEYEVADALQKSNDDYETLMKGHELYHSYPDIPWKQIFQMALIGWKNLPNINSYTFLITSKSWLKQLNKWFKTLSLDTWKIWLSVNMLLYALPLLPPPYDDMEFELYGHKLRGQSEKKPQTRLALHLAEKWLSASLGETFVQQYVPEYIKKQSLEIAKEIRNVASEVVSQTEWLEPATRLKAKKKVQKLYLSVAYPSKFKKDIKTSLHPEKLVYNVLKLAEADFIYELDKVNKTLENSEWDDSVFAVNAYYYNEGNRLILPSGILRWPFFHSKASDGWNFGGLGATIGHEICHAFDEDGKNYDEHGFKKTWWSNKESERFEEKTESLIELYNKTKYFDQNINGSLTLSENIADLAGLSISLNALKKRLLKKGVKEQEYKKQLQDFFKSYATSWRTKEKKQKALQSIFMDVHAPAMARVNNIVCQFDDWYECFDVKPGDNLYKAPEERIRIF